MPAPERVLQRHAVTTMSNPHLPPEILDHIVDHLHDTQYAIRNCSLLSKSWVQRTQKCLFAGVAFPSVESLRSWKETFPDPSTSPARYAKTLYISCPHVVTAADAESGGWIRGFSRVEQLHVGAYVLASGFKESATPLVPFHGFSPVIKSLRVVILALPPSPIINLILSFPLLEDLAVTVYREMSADNGDGSESDEIPTITQPPTPPMLTGSLRLYLVGGLESFTRRLLSLPGGIHYRNLTLTLLREDDFLTAAALVEGCSHTLESLDVSDAGGMSVRYLRPHPLLTIVRRPL
jgi:hypothetical protein